MPQRLGRIKNGHFVHLIAYREQGEHHHNYQSCPRQQPGKIDTIGVGELASVGEKRE